MTDPRLTPREHEIALLAGSGLKNKEIAEALCLAEKTVLCTLTRAYAKLSPRHAHPRKRMVLVAYARRQEQGGGEAA